MLSLQSLALAALTYLPTSALAQVAFSNANFNGITIGVPFALTWQGDGTPVSITLLTGSPSDIIPVVVIATHAPSPSFLWTPTGFSPSGEYALEITQSGLTSYAGPFAIAISAPTPPAPSFTTTYDSGSVPPPSASSTPGTVTPSSLSSSATPLPMPAVLMSFLTGGPLFTGGVPHALKGPYATGVGAGIGVGIEAGAPYVVGNRTVGGPTTVGLGTAGLGTVGCTGTVGGGGGRVAPSVGVQGLGRVFEGAAARRWVGVGVGMGVWVVVGILGVGLMG